MSASTPLSERHIMTYHVPASDAARAFHKPQAATYNKYGEELSSDLAVLNALRSTLIDFADFATEKAETYRDAQEVTHAFETLWAMLDEKHEILSNEIEKRREEMLS